MMMEFATMHKQINASENAEAHMDEWKLLVFSVNVGINPNVHDLRLVHNSNSWRCLMKTMSELLYIYIYTQYRNTFWKLERIIYLQ